MRQDGLGRFWKCRSESNIMILDCDDGRIKRSDANAQISRQRIELEYLCGIFISRIDEKMLEIQ